MYVVGYKKFKVSDRIDSIYKPIMVEMNGGNEGYLSDNKGDNISHKNPNYYELTALLDMEKRQQ